MKGVALCGFLFFVLAVVLVYAANNAMGMRTTGFAPVAYVPLQLRSQTMSPPVPQVEVKSVAQPPQQEQSQIAAPEVTVESTKPRRHRFTQHVKPPQATPDKPDSTEPAKKTDPAPVKAKAQPKLKPAPTIQETKPAPTQPAPGNDTPTYKPRDVTDSGPLSDDDRDWQQRTLAKWRSESVNSATQENQQTTGATAGRIGFSRVIIEAHKKKKRHRFLFIRW